MHALCPVTGPCLLVSLDLRHEPETKSGQFIQVSLGLQTNNAKLNAKLHAVLNAKLNANLDAKLNAKFNAKLNAAKSWQTCNAKLNAKLKPMNQRCCFAGWVSIQLPNP